MPACTVRNSHSRRNTSPPLNRRALAPDPVTGEAAEAAGADGAAGDAVDADDEQAVKEAAAHAHELDPHPPAIDAFLLASPADDGGGGPVAKLG
jgi:hypothetical protein